MAALVLGLALAQAAAARTPSAQRSERAVKAARRGPLRLFYANPAGRAEVQFYAFPGGTRVGAEFDVIDEVGWLGRARVARIEHADSGCPNLTYQLATARYLEPPAREAREGIMVAIATFGPARLERRARLLRGHEVRSRPPAAAAELVPDVALDLDGDRAPDVLRYSYECPASAAAPHRALGWCIDTWVRERATWRAAERLSFAECY